MIRICMSLHVWKNAGVCQMSSTDFGTLIISHWQPLALTCFSFSHVQNGVFKSFDNIQYAPLERPFLFVFGLAPDKLPRTWCWSPFSWAGSCMLLCGRRSKMTWMLWRNKEGSPKSSLAGTWCKGIDRFKQRNARGLTLFTLLTGASEFHWLRKRSSIWTNPCEKHPWQRLRPKKSHPAHTENDDFLRAWS